MSQIQDKKLPIPAGINLNPQGIAKVEAERKQLGITEEMLERSRRENLNRPF